MMWSYPQTRSSRRSRDSTRFAILDQVAQQLELAAGQANRHAVDGDIDRVEVGDEMLALVDHRRLGVVAAAAQHGAHAGGELARAERFGDVVVRAQVEPGDAIALASSAPSA